MTTDCTAVYRKAKRQPEGGLIHVPSFILLKSLSQNSRRTSIFLFVLHGANAVSRLLREAIFCLF